MDGSVTYRDGLDADLPVIVGFQLAMARETEGLELDREVCSRGVAALFANPERGAYYVAEEGGAVIGSLMITHEWSDWRNGDVWWIQSVYVVPEQRRRGIYAGLYGHIKARVEKDDSVRGIRLYVDRRNADAQRVYERLGMNGEHYRVYEWMKEF